MFGRRNAQPEPANQAEPERKPVQEQAPAPELEAVAVEPVAVEPVTVEPPAPAVEVEELDTPEAPPINTEEQEKITERMSNAKVAVFTDLLDAVDLGELSKLHATQIREEISDMVGEIVIMRNLVLSADEQQQIIGEICDDVLGLGPLEPLLARDDIADIMVNGAETVYIETDGKIELTDVKFRDNAQMMNN